MLPLIFSALLPKQLQVPRVPAGADGKAPFFTEAQVTSLLGSRSGRGRHRERERGRGAGATEREERNRKRGPRAARRAGRRATG
ncbi:hypothetical protein C2845_PM06G20940 [Panicum miliaceum]|uniref:Uncharacterized protein n=1 Tax=Panicum miliaceum TaxID=4540 RepID=A0A3L6R5S9_PANMI|nr:hypothetical protein C2845_PM06G20940 [Panicum miliaceum]